LGGIPALTDMYKGSPLNRDLNYFLPGNNSKRVVKKKRRGPRM